jgi:hypothetical protein
MENGGGTVDGEVLRLLSKHLERSTAASEATRDEMQDFRVDMAKGLGSLTSSVESYGRQTLLLVALAMFLLAGAAGLNVYFTAGGATLSAAPAQAPGTP